MHGYDRAELGLVPLADSFCLEPSHCMPAEPTFASCLEQASLIACLSNQPFAAYTQRQDFAAPGCRVGRIAVAGGHGPHAGRGPGAEAAAIHGVILSNAVIDLQEGNGISQLWGRVRGSSI